MAGKMTQVQPSSKGTEMQACPVCASQNSALFMSGVFDSETTNVMECMGCGLQFLDPLMSEQEEQEYYDGYYRKQECRHFKAMNLIDLQERALQHYEQYSSVYLGLISGAKTILEIGSGTGGFLRFVRSHFPEIRITAIERCAENVVFLREGFGEEAVVSGLEDLRGQKFDLVVAFGVFEHVRDSRGFLANLRSCLAPGGRLALNVPNKNSALVYAYKLDEFKKFSYMKQHYYTFTEQSFDLLAAQTGYVVNQFNYMQVWGLDNHLSWLRYREPRDFSDMSKFISRQTLDSYNQDLIARKMTDLFMTILAPVDPLGPL